MRVKTGDPSSNAAILYYFQCVKWVEKNIKSGGFNKNFEAKVVKRR